MSFEPVFWPEGVSLDGKVSQTFLRHLDLCPRSAWLYQLYRGKDSAVQLVRGSAGHRVLELGTVAMIEAPRDVAENVAMIPGDVIKAIVDEVLADPAYPVPISEHDYLRELSYRWAEETAIEPDLVVSVETLFVWRVAGYEVRCRIDFAQMIEDGAAVHVEDYKTGRGAPPFDEVARKRPDGTLAAKHFQLILYALVLAFGVPVREETCPRCGGRGLITLEPEPVEVVDDCPDCRRGRVEIPLPYPVASRVGRFDLEFVYPGIENIEKKMVRRPVSLTRAELEVYRISVEGQLRVLSYRERTGDWPAVQSDQACEECPASALCPIPAELRDHRGTINEPWQAAEALEVRARTKATNAAIQKELRKFVEHNGPVFYGNNMVAEIVYSEHEKVFDRPGYEAAVQRAVEYGEPLERWRYVRTDGRRTLSERPLTAIELAERSSEGSNHGEQDDEGAGAGEGGGGSGAGAGARGAGEAAGGGGDGA